MSKAVKERLRQAGEYQRMAIRALFPEEMKEHLDVIEKEVKQIFMEAVMEMAHEKEGEPQKKEKGRKVEIL